LPDSIADVYPSAEIAAANETGLDEDRFPDACPYTDRQIVASEFFPD
jgi:hypothetical protein